MLVASKAIHNLEARHLKVTTRTSLIKHYKVLYHVRLPGLYRKVDCFLLGFAHGMLEQGASIEVLLHSARE